MNERLTWKSAQQNEHEHKAQSRKWPNDANDPPRSERSRCHVVEPISPIPQRSNPDLLRTLNNTRAEDPHFGGCSSFFTKVESEEGESTSRSYRVRSGRDVGKDIVGRKQPLADKGKSDKEEGNAEEEPREGKDPNGRFVAGQQIPNERSNKKDRAGDI